MEQVRACQALGLRGDRSGFTPMPNTDMCNQPPGPLQLRLHRGGPEGKSPLERFLAVASAPHSHLHDPTDLNLSPHYPKRGHWTRSGSITKSLLEIQKLRPRARALAPGKDLINIRDR